MSFGYKLYDSSCGDCAVNHYLQRVASELRLPQRLHSPTATDLGSEDLPLLISLIDKATDDEFLQSRNLRGRRTSRSAEIPAQGLVRALQTAVSSSYLQKLVADKTDSASGDNSGAEGVLLAFTPALADEVSAKLFVGSDAYTAAGSLPAAISQQLPAKLVIAASALSLRFCWLSADEGSVSIDRASEFKPLADLVRNLFKLSAVVLPAAVAALPTHDGPAFAALLSLPYEPEAVNDTSNTIEEVWPTDDASLDTLKCLVSSLERPYAGRATNEGKRKLKVATRTNILAKKTAGIDGSGDPAAGDGVGKTGRGQRLREKALLKQRTEVSARSGGGGGAAGGNGQQVRADSVPAVGSGGAKNNTAVAGTESVLADPLTVEQAIEILTNGLESVVERLLSEGPSPPPPAAAAKTLSESLQKLVSTAFSGVLAHEAATCEDPNDALDVTDIRIALGSRAVTPAAEFKAQHAARVPYEKQVAFTWTCAAQVLLRMAIASHGTAPGTATTSATTQGGRLDSATYTEILNLLQIVVATMQPIPSGGQTFFREGVKPCFGTSVLAADVRRLESTLWEDEDSDDVASDGGLVALRTKAASLEVSGETPEAPGNKVAGKTSHGGEGRIKPAHGAGGADKKKTNAVAATAAGAGGRGPLVALPPRARQTAGRNGSQSQPTGSVGNNPSHSLRSADGSGVNGSVSAATAGATAATRKAAGSLTDAEFLSRRYANSKQYSMQLRVGGAPQNAARAKQMAAVAAGGIMSHQAAPTSKLTRPGGKGGAGGGAGALHQSSKGRVPGTGNRNGATATVAGTAGASRAVSPRKKERLPRAVPDTPQGEQKHGGTAVAAAAAGGAGADDNKLPAVNPRQLFSHEKDLAAPATLEAIPNTTPREMRAAARTGPGIGASPLRQNLFGLPGAIIPTTQEEREEDVDTAILPAVAAVPVARATWFTGAVVPKGNVGRPAQQQQPQQVAAAVMAMPAVEEPVVEAAVPAVEKDQVKEIEAVKEPAATAAAVVEASTGVATRRCSTAAAAAAAEEKEKAGADPREQRRKTRASAAAEEVAVAPQKKGGKGKKTAAAAAAVVEVPAAPVNPPPEEALALVPAVEEEQNKPRKRTRSIAAATEEPTASLPTAGPAPSKRRASSRLQHTSKSAAPAPTATRTNTRTAAAAKKDEEHEVASPPTAPDAVVDAAAQPEPALPESPAAAPAVLDFQTIMAAAVVVNDTAELAQVPVPPSPAVPVAQEPEQPEEEPEAVAMPPPPPPVLAPEAVPPPPPPAPLFSPPALQAKNSPPMVTPVTAPAPTPSHVRTASVLGKRSLAGLTGRTPATKRGRLGNMLAVGAKPSARPLPKPAEISPPRHEIEDIGSPAKPSPYADDFALPANSPGRRGKKKGAGQSAGLGANRNHGGARPPRGGLKNPSVVKKMDLSLRRVAAVAAAEPADSSAGESIGDAPGESSGAASPLLLTETAGAGAKKTRFTSKLKPLSPIQQQDDADSDAEDEAMLQAAANGDLSPPPGSFDEEEEEGAAAAAANASVLETTPAAENEQEEDEDDEEVVTTTLPRAGRQAKSGVKQTTAPRAKKTATKRASKSVWTKTKKKRKTSKPAANKQQQLRMSKLAARQEKATGVEGVPSIGDDIKCIMPTSNGQDATIHCQIVKIESTEKDRCGGWVCKAEVQPINNEESSSQQFAVLSFMVQLQSAQLCSWDAELLTAGEWAHMQAVDASPMVTGHTGGYMAPAETARHNAAARNQERDSLDSVPVLPETAERLRSKGMAAGEFISPRMMRPVHLDMDKAAGHGGGGGRQTNLPAAMAAVVTSAMKAARRDSLGSGGTGNTASYGLRQGMVSPAAHAAAMGMLGALYHGGTPQPPQNVEEELQAAFSPQRQWATPGAAMA